MTWPVVVLFYGGTSWLSRLIQKVTGSPFSHVAIYLQSSGRLYEALGNGIVLRRGAEAEEREKQAKAWAVTFTAEMDYLQMRAFLDRRVNDKYAFINFLAAGINTLFPRLPLVRSSGRRYICSGLVAEALCKGVFDFDNPELMTPGDLAQVLGVRDVNL